MVTTTTIKENGHDSRRGFVENKFCSIEERREDDKKSYQLAIRYMRKRLRLKSGKPRISTYLMTTKIPQVFDKFLMPRAKKACVLGMIHIGAGGKFNDAEIDWWHVNHHFDVFQQEWGRPVKCPKCSKRNSLGATMYHLNDIHKASNYFIGKWLKKYHL